MEASHRTDPLLQLAVVGLEPVVQVLDLSVSAGCRKPSLTPQRGDRLVVGGVLVGRDNRRPVMRGTAQRLAQEAFGGLGRALGRQVEVERLTPVADGTLKVHPFAPDLHVCLVDVPAAAVAVAAPLNPAIEFRRVVLDPAVDGGVIDREAALGHHLLEVALAQGVAALPAHAQQDDVGGEVPALERCAHARPLPSLQMA